MYLKASLSPSKGHYARKSSGPRAKLLRAVDRHKDQTYYLSSLSEASLNRALFPIGGLTKPEVREIARKHNLVTAKRPESMGLCFVGEKGKFRDFLGMHSIHSETLPYTS